MAFSVPPLVVPGAALLRLIWSFGTGGAGGVNVIGASITGGTTVTQTLANTLDSSIKTALTSSGFAAQLHTTTALVAVAVRDIRAAHMVEYVGTGGSVSGTGTGDPLPRQVAYVVSIKTAKAGARYRGRTYFGGLTETDNDTSAAAAAAVATNSVAFMNALASTLSGSGMGLAVVSRPAYEVTYTKTNVIPGGTNQSETRTTDARPGEVTPYTSVSARNLVWDSQRRRTSAGSASTLFSRAVAFAEEGGEVQTFAEQRARSR